MFVERNWSRLALSIKEKTLRINILIICICNIHIINYTRASARWHLKPYEHEGGNMKTKKQEKIREQWMIVIKAMAVAVVLAGVKLADCMP